MKESSREVTKGRPIIVISVHMPTTCGISRTVSVRGMSHGVGVHSGRLLQSIAHPNELFYTELINHYNELDG